MFKIDGRKIKSIPSLCNTELFNHNGSIKAKDTILAAKRNRANAIKLQTYTADSMTIDCDKDFKIKSGLWNGYKLYDLYKEASTPYKWHKELFDFAKNIGIFCFSTPLMKRLLSCWKS